MSRLGVWCQRGGLPHHRVSTGAVICLNRTQIADIRNVVEGDPSPDGQGVLAIQRGIEVGHVFYLGTKYSQAMNATFLDVDGKPKHFEMGCYGIGVTRILGAAIEQKHDERGIIWPDAIAPFTVVICPVGYDRSEAVKAAADQLHADLLAKGVDVILDDRGERPGAMFADWELIGVPHRVVLGDKSLKEGLVEYQGPPAMPAADQGGCEPRWLAHVKGPSHGLYDACAGGSACAPGDSGLERGVRGTFCAAACLMCGCSARRLAGCALARPMGGRPAAKSP
jgi:hypothetical protein